MTEVSEPSPDELESVTYAAFADMDASPTKAWLVAHRRDAQWKQFYDIAFARRPAEELYDLRRDPHQTTNVAADQKYAATKNKMAAQLTKILRHGAIRVRPATANHSNARRSPNRARSNRRQRVKHNAGQVNEKDFFSPN